MSNGNKTLFPIDYTSKDYEAFRNDMINLIPRKLPQWTDFSSSDPGITIIELLAYGLDILSYYQDRIANEVYLATATQKKSIIDICKLINYRLRPALPSRTTLVFEIEPKPYDFVIPKGFIVSTEQTQYEEAIFFETDTDLVIPAGNTGLETDEQGNYLYTVTATQGITIYDEIIGSSNGTPNQRFPLKYPSVINYPKLGFQGPIISVNEGAGFEIWQDITESIIDSTETGKHYLVEVDENDITWIIFGDGVTGKIPAIGVDNIRATYRIGGGFHTNVGTNTIVVLQSALDGVKSVRNIVPATGGLDAETPEEARVMAPKFLKTASRAVTKEDFETLAKTVPGVAKAMAQPDPNDSRTVNVTIAPVGGGVPTDDVRQRVFDLLDSVKPILTHVVIHNPKYLQANLTIKVTVLDNYSQFEVRTYVDEEIKTLFSFENRDFGKGEYISKLYEILNKINGVKFIEVLRMTVNPRVDWITVTGNPTWSPITINPTNNLDGKWKVVMTSATNFQVYFDSAGDGTFSTLKGTGSFGTQFTSNGGEISFTITAGNVACAAGDFWVFRTSPYLGNIEIEPDEILLLNSLDYNVILQGGWVG